MNVVIVTGVSGSGKGTALRALEDIGYYCIDNLPFKLLSNFLELTRASQEEITKIAILMDLRSGNIHQEQFELWKKEAHQDISFEVVMLDATDEVIHRRFQTTRRRHFFSTLPIAEAIQKEKKIFDPIKQYADVVVDTSNFNIHQLRKYMHKAFKHADKNREMNVVLLSFGYTYGVPTGADVMMDVRFLPNPYFIDDLKEKTGKDDKVIEYLMAQSQTKEFLDKYLTMIDFLIPQYQAEGKSYLTLAIGCTGGRHRSVMVVEHLKRHLAKTKLKISVKHRDIKK